MKKIFTFFAAALLAAGAMAQSYGIAVNGTTYYAGNENPTPQDPSFKEYMVLGLNVHAGDQLQLWDPSGNNGSGAGWAVDLDGASTKKIRKDGNHYVCDQEGCFDFYIKLKYEHDQLYIGEGECKSPEGTPIGGGGQPGGGGQGSGVYDYYIRGYINNKDLETPTAEELFEKGILADFSFTGKDGKSYFYVMACESGQLVGKDYMLKEYIEGGTHVTLYDKDATGGVQKWGVPAGKVTFYLYDNGDGTLELSIEPLPGRTPIGGDSQAIDNTFVGEKAYKAIIDGQLRIIRGEKVFDATGRQL